MNKICVMLLAFFSLCSCIKLRNSQMSIRIQTELENKLNSLNNLQSEQSYIQLSEGESTSASTSTEDKASQSSTKNNVNKSSTENKEGISISTTSPNSGSGGSAGALNMQSGTQGNTIQIVRKEANNNCEKCAQSSASSTAGDDAIDIADYKVDNYILSKEIDDLNHEIDKVEQAINTYDNQIQVNNQEKEKIYQKRLDNQKNLDKKVATLQSELINTNKISYSYNQYYITDSGTLEEFNDEYAHHDSYYSDEQIKAKCNAVHDCGECVSNNDCVWCPNEKLCSSVLSDGTFTDICAKYQLSTCDKYV